MKFEEIAMEAEKLTEEDRASLAARLLHGLEKPHHHVTDEEVARRMREADDDPGVMISFEQLIAGVKTRAG
jgi:hypothetical protein